MMLAKVVANVVATMKNPDCDGYKLLVVRPVDPNGQTYGGSLLALDAVQAGIGDTVLVIDEGGSGRAILGAPDKRILRTVISGIVDEVSTAVE